MKIVKKIKTKKEKINDKENENQAMHLAHVILSKKDLDDMMNSEIRNNLTVLSKASLKLTYRIRSKKYGRMLAMKEVLETPWIDSNIDVEAQVDDIMQRSKSILYDTIWLRTISKAKNKLIRQLEENLGIGVLTSISLETVKIWSSDGGIDNGCN